MKLTSPLPQPLPQECIKASKIFRSFVTPGRNGLDKVIPHSVLQHAKGFAIFTVVKAGFVFSARAGAGVVIARLPDGSFSAPSAIGTAGMGFGGQAGAEVTEFLIVLNSHTAVKQFMSAGSLTLGGNMSLAVGPLGRNGEASAALNTKGKVAAMYSYSKTKGLFGGVSVEGSVIVERQDANAIAYGADVTAKQLLSGSIDPPDWASPLITALEGVVGSPVPGWINDEPSELGTPSSERPSMSRGYSFTGVGSDGATGDSSRRKKSISLNPFGKKTPKTPLGDDEESYFGDSAHAQSRKSKDYSPPRSEKPTPSQNQFDGFAESDDDDPWGDSPNFRPARSQNSISGRLRAPTTAAAFPTHFDSDFVPDAPAPYRSPPPTSHSSPPARSQPAPANKDPFDDLTTSMNAFNFSLPHSALEPPDTQPHQFAAPRAIAMQSSATGSKSWVDQFQLNHRRSPSTPSYGSDSGSSIPTSARTSPLSSKPSRSLSLKRGVYDKAPPGAVKAIALYDYSAKEDGDLSFHEGDIIYVLEKTETSNDWWTGRLAADPDPRSKGIFPANFVSLEL